MCLFFCKQKTAYEKRMSDWSSDVCSSDLGAREQVAGIFARMIGRAGDHQLGGAVRSLIGVDQVVQALFGNEPRDGEQEVAVRDPQPLEYQRGIGIAGEVRRAVGDIDRKSTRLNSSH